MNIPTIDYCLGFLFSSKGDQVVLIEKTHHKPHYGLLNGIGGQVGGSLEEPIKETPLEAMIRESLQEIGTTPDWEGFGAILTEKKKVIYKIFLFKAFDDDAFSQVKTMTDEEVFIADVSTLRILNVVNDLRYFIPMALDKDVSDITIIKQ